MAHSYSSISKFETCPRQYWHTYIKKDTVFEQSEQAAYGSEMHNFIDAAVKGTQEFTPRYEFLKPIVTQLKSIPGTLYTEYALAFHQDWSKTTWGDKTSFIKGKSDATIFHPTEPKIKIFDWKFAGKVEPSKYQLEMDMFALLHFKAHQDIEMINSGLIWLKTPGPESKFAYNRSNLPELEDTIMHKIERIEDAIASNNFPMKKSGLCYGWCPAHNCINWKPKKEFK